jgi:hypothetical protein
METNHDIHKDEIDQIIPPDAREVFSNLGNNKEEGEAIGEIFYNSIKSFFEVGLELASNLNLELLIDKFKSFQNEEKKK